MKYFKIINDGYIESIIKYEGNFGGIEITEDEYNEILEATKNKPADNEGKIYKLRTDLTYEEADAPIEQVGD